MFYAILGQFVNVFFMKPTKYIGYAANRSIHLCLDRDLAAFAEYRRILLLQSLIM